MTVDDIEHMAAAEVADINGAVVQQNAADLMGRGPIYGEEVNDFSTAPPLSAEWQCAVRCPAQSGAVYCVSSSLHSPLVCVGLYAGGK
eukprot:scaffold95617_cov63-Phaeocystis_antarctica.AAC.2